MVRLYFQQANNISYCPPKWVRVLGALHQNLGLPAFKNLGGHSKEVLFLGGFNLHCLMVALVCVRTGNRNHMVD